ncbi:hypothetical protein ACP70R_020951 [Stipagrostis hirtigluma subsp. patula]
MLPYSGDHRRSPPPLPPRAAFSSSLSPSAAPFPADPSAPGPGSDLPTAPSVYAAAGEWGSASWMEPPVSYMAPVAAAAAAAAPTGYKVFSDGLMISANAEHLLGEDSRNAPYGIYSGNHFSTFAGLHSLRSESSNAITEKHPGTCQESSEALSNSFGPSVFHQQQNAFVSKLLDHSGAEDTVPYPPRQDLNQYPFGSAYDKYMTQLSSCSTDRQPHILSTRYVDSSEMAKSTVPVMNGTIGESSFSFSSYMNPCRINLDYFDCVWNEPKDLGYQTTDRQHGKWSNSVDNMATAGNYPLNPLGENHLGTESEKGRPMQGSSEMKHDLGSYNSKPSSSEVGFVHPREISSELLEVNNTTVDSPCWKGAPATCQPSFGIMENNDAPHAVIGTVGYNNPHQSLKATDLSSEYPGRFPERDGASGSENDRLKTFKFPVMWQPIDLRVHNDMATHASYLPDKQHAQTQKFYDFREDSKNVITSSQQGSSFPESHTAVRTEVISKNATSPIALTPRVHFDNLTSGNPPGNSPSAPAEKEQSTQKRGEDPSQCYPGAEGNMPNMSCDSSSSTRVIFLKLMHNLSVVLLSTCKGGSSLQEDEEELLQSVIQNLTAASCRRSKVEQKTDDGLSSSSQMRFRNVDSVRDNFWMAMGEHYAPENAESEFKTTVSQVLNKLPEDKMVDDSEVSQASIYKNLWLEAEAEACKLKYELQLARTKLAMTKVHNNIPKVPDSREGSKGSNSSIPSTKPENHGKESIKGMGMAALQCQGGFSGERQSPAVNKCTVNGVDADVFARLKVLQSHVDNVSSFEEIDREEQQEASKKSGAVEDAVMSRLKVLKSRPYNITSSSQESIKHLLDSSTNREDNVDDAVMRRLRILESRPNNLNFLGEESSKQPLDASTSREDEVDDDVMARLRILGSHPNNLNFLSVESSKQPLDASTTREDEVDDAVMARLRILKSRPDNITSMGDDAVMARLRILKSRPDNINSMGDGSKGHEEACSDQSNGDEVSIMESKRTVNIKRCIEQVSKFMSYGDLADRLRREDSVCGLDFTDGTYDRENETGGSADVVTSKRCKAPSDETNEDTVQSEDSDENHVRPQTAGETHVCTEGSEEARLISSPVHQGGGSPSEWEHVLKENFFHPGK